MHRVWEQGEGGGRRMLGKHAVCPQREWWSKFHIHWKERQVFMGCRSHFSCSHFIRPRSMTLTQCVPVYSAFQQANGKQHSGWWLFRAAGKWSCGNWDNKSKEENGGGENYAPQHQEEIPLDSSQQRRIRLRTPLCHPLLLQAEIKGGGKRRRTKMKTEARWKMKATAHTSQEVVLLVRSESTLIYTSVKCTDGRWITDTALRWFTETQSSKVTI